MQDRQQQQKEENDLKTLKVKVIFQWIQNSLL